MEKTNQLRGDVVKRNSLLMIDLDDTLLTYDSEHFSSRLSYVLFKNIINSNAIDYKKYFATEKEANKFFKDVFIKSPTTFEFKIKRMVGLIYKIEENKLVDLKDYLETKLNLSYETIKKNDILRLLIHTIKNDEKVLFVSCGILEAFVNLEFYLRNYFEKMKIDNNDCDERIENMKRKLFLIIKDSYIKHKFDFVQINKILRYNLDMIFLYSQGEKNSLSIFKHIIKYPKNYIRKFENLQFVRNKLIEYRDNGNKVVLVTNSTINYVKDILPICFGSDWKCMFDLMVSSSNKPEFFMKENIKSFVSTSAEKSLNFSEYDRKNKFCVGGSFNSLLTKINIFDLGRWNFYLVEDNLWSGVFQPLKSVKNMKVIFINGSIVKNKGSTMISEVLNFYKSYEIIDIYGFINEILSIKI